MLNSYPAHADEPELVDFVSHLDPQRLKRIFLVHGDPPRQLALYEALAERGYANAHGPARGEVFDL